MSKSKVTNPKPIPVEQLRPEDRARERIPWKEMKVGSIYQRKDGRYYIYAGRSVVYHTYGDVMTRESDKHFYTYIYIDYPGVICKAVDEDTLSILCSSAKIRSSEYRDIARTKIGELEGFTAQSQWKFSDFLVRVEPGSQSKGSTKRIVKYTEQERAIYSKFSKAKKSGKTTAKRATKKASK